jgi:hypothetical protein
MAEAVEQGEAEKDMRFSMVEVAWLPSGLR